MECQKLTIFWDNDLRGMYNPNSQIKIKITSKLSLGDYNDAYILAKGTITINGGPETADIAANQA